MLNCLHIMEKELEISFTMLKEDILIKYLEIEDVDFHHGFNQLVIQKSAVSECPDQRGVITAIEKKINRSEILKTHKLTSSLCVLLMLSRGYSLNSSILKNIPDTFVERCWECLQHVSYTIPEPSRSWMRDTIGTRSPPDFAALFCPSRQLPSRISIDDEFEYTLNSMRKIEKDESDLPSTIWHRDDTIMQSILLHMRQRSRFS